MQPGVEHKSKNDTLSDSASGTTIKFCTPANSEFYKSNPYSPLSHSTHEIRVLHLSPVEPSTPLSARLVTISLDDQEARDQSSFIAISYAAESYKDTEVIYFNGVPFNAFGNLDRALRQVLKATHEGELQDAPRLLWADQICINQSDPHERSYQVGFMRNIYQSAKMVLASLGEDHSAGRCVKVLERLQHWSNFSTRMNDTEVLIEGQVTANFRDVQFQQEWSAFHQLLECQW